jgi:hypothetical protein
MIWLMLLMGAILLGACFLLPREIGHEETPLSNIRLKRPDMEGLALRLNPPKRRMRPRPVIAPASAFEPDAPSAMGAPQPVLTEQPGGLAFPR